MDLSFSKEEVAFRDEVRAFFRDNVPPSTRQKLQEGRHLGKHEIPAALDFVDDLPRTSVGKLSRHELRNQLPAQQLAQPKQQQLGSGGRS